MRMMAILAAVVAGVMALAMAGCGGGDVGSAGTQAAGTGKSGVIVKQPEEPWFQREWRFADETGAKQGFTVIHEQGQDGEKVSSAIQNLATEGAKGFVICAPDVSMASRSSAIASSRHSPASNQPQQSGAA